MDRGGTPNPQTAIILSYFAQKVNIKYHHLAYVYKCYNISTFTLLFLEFWSVFRRGLVGILEPDFLKQKKTPAEPGNLWFF
jgi:hypothetical protein